MRWLTIAQIFQRVGVALAICMVVLSLRAATGPPSTEIINRADLQFFAPVGISNFITSDPVRTFIESGVAPVVTFRDAAYGTLLRVSGLDQPLFVQVFAPSCSTNPLVLQTNTVVLRSERTGDRETASVVETVPGSGVYRLLEACPVRDAALFPPVDNNGFVELVTGDSVTAETAGCGFGSATTIILIDPGGIVFDSRSGAPVGGAQVTLADASSGSPALVFDFDGVTPAPSTVRTGPAGRYQFPAVNPGVYRLLIVPPPGYTAPSQVPVTSLPAGHFVGQPASYGGDFPVNLATGPVRVDVPVDPVSATGGGLFVQKIASRQVAEIGDSVEFTVRVKNVSGAALASVKLTDWLPAGFAYQKRSARLENSSTPDPAGGGGPTLQFALGPIANDATVSLTYRVRVGPGAQQGDGVNKAQAATDGPAPLKSNMATVQVRIQGGVFADEGFLVGKVFVDANTNRVQDPGEPGVPGVRLFLEDGTYAITDGEGKYSLYGLRPLTHVLKLDSITLPSGARPEVLSTRNAGSAGSIFVDLKKGELRKADFAIAPATPEILDEIKERRKKLEGGGAEIGLAVQSKLTPDGVLPLRGDPRGQPASGVVTGTPSSGPSAAGNAAPLGAPSRQPGPVNPAAAPGSTRVGPVNPDDSPVAGPSNDLLDADTVAPPPIFSPVLLPELNDRNSDLPPFPLAVIEPFPSDGLVLTLTNLDNSVGFPDLKDGDILPMAQATVRVKGQYGATIMLLVNGELVPASRLGRLAVIAERQIEAWEFVGVALRPGTNQLEAAQYDAFGNPRGSKVISVIAPDKLARIRLILPRTDQPADGHSVAQIEVRLEDEHGIPVTARTPLTLEASLGKWQAQDLDAATRGTQVFIEGGRAGFALLAPLEPGDARVVVSSGILHGEATLAFLPDLRPMLAVGVIEGQLSLSKLDLRNLAPARSNDGFEEELRNFSVSGNDGKFTAAGRAAFFPKGRIKGEYLLTAGYDSEKQTHERLFRDIQPDQFYPVYGDSSVRGFDAQSSGNLYVRIDKRKCYLLYGDLLTSSPSEGRGLGNYSRSLTGVREHYEKSNIVANVWASQDSARQVIEELSANGTSGPYQFRIAHGIVNSEKVEILTRDRNQPSLILKAETMTRFSDYEFEPFTGRILFKAPVSSLDANLNPISIRVTYEVDQGGDKFWVYGTDAQVKVHRRLELGGAAVRDENPQGAYGLYSANATVQLAPKTFVLGEFAHSDAEVMEGDAWRVDARHSSGPFDARVYYGRADNTFSNAAAILTGGRIEAGAKLAYRIAPNTRLVGQALDTESLGNQGNRQGFYGGVEHTFVNQMKLELGGRHSTESAAPASASTVGVTPNEVTSVRAKVTTPVPRVKGASVYGEYEADVTESGKQLAAFGGEYQLKAKTRLYARHEFINSLGGPFELNTAQQRNTTIFGLDTAYMKDGSVFNEYRARDAVAGRESEAAIGLRNLWDVAPGVRLHTTFERINPIEGGDQNEATAGTAAIELTRNPDAKATARVEIRSSTPNNSLLNTLGYARKLSRDWTLLGRTIVYLVDDKGPADADKIQARFQAGMAWRQTQTDRWSALMKYEFKIEDGDVLSNAELHRKVNILSLHANYQPTADWFLSGHYAGKLAFEESDGRDEVYDAHLLAFRTTYDLTKRFDLGLNSAALFNGDLRSVQYAIGPEIGFTIKRNLRLGLGYNFTGFQDRDLSAGDYTQRGVYIALRFKFDEETIGLGRKKEEGR